MLFDPATVEPGKTGPQAHGESCYQYIATANKPAIETLRIQLDEWISDYPEEHQGELIQRIKTSGNEFDSELFELLMYTMLFRSGFEVSIHPDLPDEVEKRPDLFVRDPDGNHLFVECVLATGESKSEVSARNLVHAVYQKIDEKLQSAAYFWSVRVLAQGPQAPKAGTIIFDVAHWLRGLDWEDVATKFAELGFKTPIRYVWDNGTWRLEFLPIPKDPAKLDERHRPIGIVRGNVEVLDDTDAILDAADFKAKRYGDGAKPFAIAINGTGMFMEELDFHDALFPRGVGSPGGFWRREDGSLRNQNVDAVIACWKCRTTGFRDAGIITITNPYRAPVAAVAAMPFPRRVCTPEGHTDSPGKGLAEILELPVGWPA